MLDDITSVALQVAIGGLSRRQDATANNIANTETPNFTASQVSFENSLAQAIAGGDPASASVSVAPTADAAGPDGNNVSLDREFVDATKTTLQLQMLTQALTARYSQLATVLKG